MAKRSTGTARQPTAATPTPLFAIGNLYANGFGVGKDLDEAMKWYCKAALLGHPQATGMVGEDRVEPGCGKSH